MSCFEGHMREYSRVSLDRFDGRNLTSTVYFLSHCHKDHMAGLDAPAFLERLKSSKEIFLYCSGITKILLLSDPVYKPLEKFIKVLEVDAAATVTIPDPYANKDDSVIVTPLHAAHCPGSVMLLFEGKEGTVLYTGDFRWETNHATTMSALKTGDSVKAIKSLYIDTTFCMEQAFFIPSRAECVEATVDLISDWLRRSSLHIVCFTSKTRYGHEQLLRDVSIRTGHKIHTSFVKHRIYEQISELQDIFTMDPETRIHACEWERERSQQSKLPCGHMLKGDAEFHCMYIRPSTMFFTMQNHRNNYLVAKPKKSNGLYRVCYSFHSSFSEIRDLVMYLKPNRAVPNVKPVMDDNMSMVQARLNGFLHLTHRAHLPSSPDGSRPLGVMKPGKVSVDDQIRKDQSDSEDLVFDSPVKSKRPRISIPSESTSPEKTSGFSSQGSISSEIISPVKSETSDTQSSYQGSQQVDEGMNLCASSSEEHKSRDVTLSDSEESYRLYVSGDSEVEEDDKVSSLSFKKCNVEESLSLDMISSLSESLLAEEDNDEVSEIIAKHTDVANLDSKTRRNISPLCISKSTELEETDSLKALSPVGKKRKRTTKKGFERNGSFDLFDEGESTDVQENVDEEQPLSEGFVVRCPQSDKDEASLVAGYGDMRDKCEKVLPDAETEKMAKIDEKVYNKKSPQDSVSSVEIEVVVIEDDSETNSPEMNQDSRRKTPYNCNSETMESGEGGKFAAFHEKSKVWHSCDHNSSSRSGTGDSERYNSDSDATEPPSQNSLLDAHLDHDSDVEIIYEKSPNSKSFDTAYEAHKNCGESDTEWSRLTSVGANSRQSEGSNQQISSVHGRHVINSSDMLDESEEVIDLTVDDEEEERDGYGEMDQKY